MPHKIILTIIAGFCAAMFIITSISYKPFVIKPAHTIRYELYSKDGLSGRFEWADVNWFGRYTNVRNFIRTVEGNNYTCIIYSNVEKTPFRISVEGLFDNHTHLRLYVDNKLIEGLDGECFASEWLLSHDSRGTSCQYSRWASGRTKHHVGYASSP